MNATARIEHMTVPRLSFLFMILEHYLLEVRNDPVEAKKKLCDLEAIKEFADAGYARISDYEVEQIATAGMFWIRGAIESPEKEPRYREVANQMLSLLSP